MILSLPIVTQGFLQLLVMEQLYRYVGPQDGMRVFFRGNLDTEGLFKLFNMCGQQLSLFPETPAEENGGCTESCEIYEME